MSLLAFVPRTWAIVAVSALAVSAASIHALQATRARTRAVFVADSSARAFVRDSMTMAATVQAPAQVETLTVTRHRTDTVFAATATHATIVHEVASRVADTVRVAFPVVDTLVVESQALAAIVPVLRDSVASERRAADVVRATLGMIAVGVRDSLHVELKRPKRTWKSSAVLTVTGAALGTAATFFTLRKQ